MYICFMGWLYFFVGVLVGGVIGMYIKSIPPPPPSNDEQIKQAISDKLDKIIQDVKNTI